MTSETDPKSPPANPAPALGDFSRGSVGAAKQLIGAGELRKARLMLEQLVETAPDADILVTLASLEVDNPKRAADALEHLKRALEIAPQHTEGWLLLANYWGLRGMPEKQKRCLEKILTYDKANRDVRDALELILMKK